MSLAATDGVRFYSSADLLHWQYESTFDRRRPGPPGVWECPDLIRMEDPSTGERHDVLLVSVNPNASDKEPPSMKRSGTQYYLGHFDGHAFEPDSSSQVPRWLDEGADYYAAVSWNRDRSALDSPPVVLGWMSNWSYAQRVPTQSWRSAMAVPRQLDLVEKNGQWSLRSTPISALKTLRRSKIHVEAAAANQISNLADGIMAGAGAMEADLTIRSPEQRNYALVLSNQKGERFAINVDLKNRTVTLDRSQSGDVAFSENFAAPMNVEIAESADACSLKLLADRSSVEIFLNDGRTAMTSLVFPTTPYTRLTIEGDSSITLQSADIFGLESIWSTASAHSGDITPTP
jgi:sucrose-6-phosphate hydrolase SacC (GH32 family)